MQEEREISLTGAMYSMAKKCKIMLLVVIVVFVAGYGFFLFRAKKASDNDETVSVAKANTAADVVKPEDVEKLKANAEKYKEYLEKSEYMKIDSSALHQRIYYYVINWKDKGLSGDTYENRSATLYGLLAAHFPSEEFRKAISSYDREYSEKSLDELVSLGRSGNTIYFIITYSDDSFVKDLVAAIEKELDSKAESYRTLVGEYELVFAQEIDRAVDGAGFKSNQAAKKTNLTNLENELKEIEKKIGNNNNNNNNGVRGLFIGLKNTLICAFVAIFCGLAVGFVLAVFGKRFESATDVSDLTGKDVVCILKKEPESWLNKTYYKRNDRYRNPERYLSILEKNMGDAGVKKLHLYNCSGSDLNDTTNRFKSSMKNLSIEAVPDENRESFYLDVKEDEAVVILVKGGDTARRDFIEMMEHLRAVGAKCAGVVFAV